MVLVLVLVLASTVKVFLAVVVTVRTFGLTALHYCFATIYSDISLNF